MNALLECLGERKENSGEEKPIESVRSLPGCIQLTKIPTRTLAAVVARYLVHCFLSTLIEVN